MKLENVLKDKTRQIDQLTNEKRNLEKIKINQDRELDTFQKEYGYEKKVVLEILYVNLKLFKISNYNDEAKQLREKIKTLQNANRLNEKTFKKQQEYLVALSNQYRIICDKLDISPSLNFTKSEELNQIITQKSKQTELTAAKRTSTENAPAEKKGRGNRSKSVKEPKEFPHIEVIIFMFQCFYVIAYY